MRVEICHENQSWSARNRPGPPELASCPKVCISFGVVSCVNKLICQSATVYVLFTGDHPESRLSERLRLRLVVLQVVVLVLLVTALDRVQLVELVLFPVDALLVLLQVPLSAELLVAQLALDLFLHPALVVHVPQHDTPRRVPLAALKALIVLAVLPLQQLRREEIVDAEHPVPQA